MLASMHSIVYLIRHIPSLGDMKVLALSNNNLSYSHSMNSHFHFFEPLRKAHVLAIWLTFVERLILFIHHSSNAWPFCKNFS